MSDTNEICPKCGSPLGEVTETPTGKKLQNALRIVLLRQRITFGAPQNFEYRKR